MLLTPSSEIPQGKEWNYETKYDGFRCILEWDKEVVLWSRNGKRLNTMFPEIIDFCKRIEKKVKPFLPLMLDGEITYLTNNYNSNFSTVQLRGRMRTKEIIEQHVVKFPCHYIVFDLLQVEGLYQVDQILAERKKKLNLLFKRLQLPNPVDYMNPAKIQAIEVFKNSQALLEKVKTACGEGVIAKKRTSTWTSEKRTNQWLKIKNWKMIHVILTQYDKVNGFFKGSVYKDNELIEVVNFKNGLTEEEDKTLKLLFQNKGTQLKKNIWNIKPSICVVIACIDFDGKSLREPRFHQFSFEEDPLLCTWERLTYDMFPIPEQVKVTHPNKPVWPNIQIEKEGFLYYLQQASPYLLPFLKNRLLTVIRYPHGALQEERFYQKNWQDAIPNYVETMVIEENRYVLCNNIETLLWLGNQLALELHIPFQPYTLHMPTEIVFDLDPPSADEFSLAIEAAIRMKAIFDQFELPSYVKTSGGKGLQLYIPLPENTFSYEQTRIFTKFVCDFLIEQEPNWFTTERLKKNRNNKLYLDYVQHQEGKTIIAPYSTRGNKDGLVATPLLWEEVNLGLKPDFFPVPAVIERIKNLGDPFRDFRENIDGQKFGGVLEKLIRIKEM